MEPDRFRVEWISASEGKRFAEIVEEFTHTIKTLGPQTKFKLKNKIRIHCYDYLSAN